MQNNQQDKEQQDLSHNLIVQKYTVKFDKADHYFQLYPAYKRSCLIVHGVFSYGGSHVKLFHVSHQSNILKQILFKGQDSVKVCMMTEVSAIVLIYATGRSIKDVQLIHLNLLTHQMTKINLRVVYARSISLIGFKNSNKFSVISMFSINGQTQISLFFYDFGQECKLQTFKTHCIRKQVDESDSLICKLNNFNKIGILLFQRQKKKRQYSLHIFENAQQVNELSLNYFLRILKEQQLHVFNIWQPISEKLYICYFTKRIQYCHNVFLLYKQAKLETIEELQNKQTPYTIMFVDSLKKLNFFPFEARMNGFCAQIFTNYFVNPQNMQVVGHEIKQSCSASSSFPVFDGNLQIQYYYNQKQQKYYIKQKRLSQCRFGIKILTTFLLQNILMQFDDDLLCQVLTLISNK